MSGAHDNCLGASGAAANATRSVREERAGFGELAQQPAMPVIGVMSLLPPHVRPS